MLRASPQVRVAALTLYYVAVLAGLILIYGRGDFSTPSFVYQGF
jgi:hypothetical protein